MSTSASTSIILVTGSWHTNFHIEPCLPPLKAAGYEVVPCPLLCVGVKEPRTTFADEVENISSKIATEIDKGRWVCVIAHSAGGFPAVEAINKSLFNNGEKKDQLRLVFVASFIDRGRAQRLSGSRGWLQVDMESKISTPLTPETIFYNDMSVEESRPFVEALRPAMLYLDNVELSSNDWKSVRKFYILCLQDNAIWEDQQRQEIAENEFEAVELDAGHCPFISQPEKFVATLKQVLTM